MPTYSFLAGLLQLVLALSAVAQVPGPVTLKDAKDEVVLDNGILTVTLVKAGGSVKAMKYRGLDMLSSGYYSMDGGKNFRGISNAEFKVHQRTPDLIDVSMTQKYKSEPQALDIEVHYVLRRGDSGLYTYAVQRHGPQHPETGYGEWRFVWKLNGDLLNTICVDDRRHWKMQSSKDTFEKTPIAEIIKVTSGVRAGQYDCKYDYAASYYDLQTWGHASDDRNVGAFMVMASQEFLNDGPSKADLNAAANINHIHFGMNHFNSSRVQLAEGEEWSKVFGPFLLYCNTGPSVKAMWDDAKARVSTERAAWPYAWVKQAEYPLAAGRGSAVGRLTIRDALRPTSQAGGAWIGLASPRDNAPPEGEPGKGWQFDSMSYQYWTKASPDGTFTVPHVRPGTYTLYAYNVGSVGEYQQAEVKVEAGQTTDLGPITWQVPHKGTRLAFEVGVPDRTAREFRGGDTYFRAYQWEHFNDILPNPLTYVAASTFVAGSTVPPLNYAHTRRNEGRAKNVWNIEYELPSPIPTGDATLVVAIASADRARAEVLSNDTPVGQITPRISGGNALLRHGISAKYCIEYVTVPTSTLKPGKNTLSLAFPPSSTPSAHIMYDYIALELP